jgi:hypothetical protein
VHIHVACATEHNPGTSIRVIYPSATMLLHHWVLCLVTTATQQGPRGYIPPEPPTTPAELFVEAARQGRFAEAREHHTHGINPDVFSDVKVRCMPPYYHIKRLGSWLLVCRYDMAMAAVHPAARY